MWPGHSKRDATFSYETRDPEFLRKCAITMDLVIDKLNNLMKRTCHQQMQKQCGWACANPAHVVQRALFEPQQIPGFPNIQKWILVHDFQEFSPLILTELSWGEFVSWDTEHCAP